ncbi:helix-turn-helix domain-containing protein [Streptomyces sp. SAJ15]|uniref:helix-turn-helix domain-containing protein n=1 Tax=Streptomyces sp. SAJ15 TaxID=2011095 RepID=UPI001184F3EB|nr:helix-turn-helix domain-containing protein [Streptomyces sp. SAJ15]TVL89782.1 hypothetical protein CD790_25635 [Streptomyces sp. SAJ15]
MTSASAAPASGFLTTGQAAARIGASAQYVRTLIHGGCLEAIDISKGKRPSFRVSEAAVVKFLAERAVGSSSEAPAA